MTFEQKYAKEIEEVGLGELADGPTMRWGFNIDEDNAVALAVTMEDLDEAHDLGYTAENVDLLLDIAGSDYGRADAELMFEPHERYTDVRKRLFSDT